MLKAQADQAEREIKKLTGQLGRAKDVETIQLKVEMLGNARERLDALQREMRDLDDTRAEIEIDADDKASADLDDVRRKASALDGIDVDIDVKATGLDDITDKLDAMPGLVGSAAGALRGLGSAAGVGAAAAAGVALADSLADASLSAEVLAGLTGDTLEDASRLQAVWQTTGADVNDLADVLLQMNGVLDRHPRVGEADRRSTSTTAARSVNASSRCSN